MEEVKMTKEEFQRELDKARSEAKKGLFTEEDLNKKVTAEVDRRVESGIQKGLETKLAKEREKWEQENSLSAEELAQKKYEEKFNELSSKEKEIAKQRNELEAKNLLANAGVPREKYEKMLPLLISDDGEATTASVQNFIDVYSETKQELETKFKSEYSGVPSPKQGSGEGKVTKEKFDGMSYADKLEFKEQNPELYKSFLSGEDTK